jgi:hypothetical protein
MTNLFSLNKKVSLDLYHYFLNKSKERTYINSTFAVQNQIIIIMSLDSKISENDYFNDPVIDNVKKDIIENIVIYSSDVPSSIQNLVASHYTKSSNDNSGKSDKECTIQGI